MSTIKQYFYERADSIYLRSTIKLNYL